MAAAAEAYRGLKGVDFTPEPPDKTKRVESIMASPPPPSADPTSPDYVEGTRCFRSYFASLGITKFCTRDVQVGNSVIPGDHEIIRFHPVGNADVGEYVTSDAAEIAKIEAHPLYMAGQIKDAVDAHAAGRRDRARVMAAQIEADPALKAELATMIGADTVETFMGAVDKPNEKAKTKPKTTRH